jgi:hypothetical protein
MTELSRCVKNNLTNFIFSQYLTICVHEPTTQISGLWLKTKFDTNANFVPSKTENSNMV